MVFVIFMRSRNQLRDAYLAFKTELQSVIEDGLIVQELRSSRPDVLKRTLAGDGELRITRPHSDQNAEYVKLGREADYCATFSPAYTSQHNSVADRVNRTSLDSARALVLAFDLST